MTKVNRYEYIYPDNGEGVVALYVSANISYMDSYCYVKSLFSIDSSQYKMQFRLLFLEVTQFCILHK